MENFINHNKHESQWTSLSTCTSIFHFRLIFSSLCESATEREIYPLGSELCFIQCFQQIKLENLSLKIYCTIMKKGTICNISNLGLFWLEGLWKRVGPFVPVLPLLELKRIIIASTVPQFKIGKMSTCLASPMFVYPGRVGTDWLYYLPPPSPTTTPPWENIEKSKHINQSTNNKQTAKCYSSIQGKNNIPMHVAPLYTYIWT